MQPLLGGLFATVFLVGVEERFIGLLFAGEELDDPVDLDDGVALGLGAGSGATLTPCL